MNNRVRRCLPAVMLGCALWAPYVRAQFAVIDIASVTQLLHQVETMASQLEAAQAQLEQARAQYQSLTGERGMEALLAGTVRNYLPTDWSQLTAILQGSGGSFAALTTDLQRNLNTNAILPGSQIAGLSPDARAQLGTARDAVALLQAVSQEALSNASNRFSALQQLINAIPTAQDAKGALDLQARIAAEQGMLQNEQTKLQVLYQMALAQQWAVREQAQERTAAGHGAFTARFEPSPF
jgi:type IV secretion system protein VirB5